MTPKYTTVTVSTIILSIGLKTNIEGYTQSILEALLPDEGELNEKEENIWIKENNKRMEAICKFLNDNNL